MGPLLVREETGRDKFSHPPKPELGLGRGLRMTEMTQRFA